MIQALNFSNIDFNHSKALLISYSLSYVSLYLSFLLYRCILENMLGYMYTWIQARLFYSSLICFYENLNCPWQAVCHHRNIWFLAHREMSWTSMHLLNSDGFKYGLLHSLMKQLVWLQSALYSSNFYLALYLFLVMTTHAWAKII